jgi:hypothetical protein
MPQPYEAKNENENLEWNLIEHNERTKCVYVYIIYNCEWKLKGMKEEKGKIINKFNGLFPDACLLL